MALTLLKWFFGGELKVSHSFLSLRCGRRGFLFDVSFMLSEVLPVAVKSVRGARVCVVFAVSELSQTCLPAFFFFFFFANARNLEMYILFKYL